MRKSGNGDAAVCVSNLMLILRGENPYERIKGLDAGLVGQPMRFLSELSEDAIETIETYEPRVDVMDVTVSLGEDGHILIEPDITVRSTL